MQRQNREAGPARHHWAHGAVVCAITAAPFVVCFMLQFVASAYRQWHDYGGPPIEYPFISALEVVPLAVLAGLAAVVGGGRSTRQFIFLTAAWSVPSLVATSVMLYDVCFPRADGDIFGGLILFFWIARSALGFVLGACGIALVASVTRPQNRALQT